MYYILLHIYEGVVVEKGFEDNKVDAGKWVGEQVIPLKDKVQVTVDLRVLESRYNRKLGIFQVLISLSNSLQFLVLLVQLFL